MSNLEPMRLTSHPVWVSRWQVVSVVLMSLLVCSQPAEAACERQEKRQARCAERVERTAEYCGDRDFLRKIWAHQQVRIKLPPNLRKRWLFCVSYVGSPDICNTTACLVATKCRKEEKAVERCEEQAERREARRLAQEEAREEARRAREEAARLAKATQACRKAPACAEQGLCESDGTRCLALTNASCSASEACRDAQRCLSHRRTCIDHCTIGSACREHGLCKTSGSECVSVQAKLRVGGTEGARLRLRGAELGLLEQTLSSGKTKTIELGRGSSLWGPALPPGTYDAIVELDGFEPLTEQLELEAGTKTKRFFWLQSKPTGKLSVRTGPGDSNRIKVAPRLARTSSAHKSSRQNEAVSTDGGSTVDGLLPGRYPLTVHAKGFGPWKTIVEIREGETTTLDFPKDVPGPSVRIVTDPEYLLITIKDGGEPFPSPLRIVGLEKGQVLNPRAVAGRATYSKKVRVVVDWSSGEEEVEIEPDEIPPPAENGQVVDDVFVWSAGDPYRHAIYALAPPPGFEYTGSRFGGTGPNGADETISMWRVPMFIYKGQRVLNDQLLLDFDLTYGVSYLPFVKDRGVLTPTHGVTLHYRFTRSGALGQMPLSFRLEQNYLLPSSGDNPFMMVSRAELRWALPLLPNLILSPAVEAEYFYAAEFEVDDGSIPERSVGISGGSAAVLRAGLRIDWMVTGWDDSTDEHVSPRDEGWFFKGQFRLACYFLPAIEDGRGPMFDVTHARAGLEAGWLFY